MIAAQAGYFEMPGARLYYEIAGSGDPLVLVHGHTLDCRMWDDQFAAFARHYRVLRYDLRGYGRSTLSNGVPYTHAGDLQALLAHLAISSAHLVGLSMGGWIATNFTLNYSHLVRSLILVDAVLIGYRWSDEWNRLWGEITSTARTAGPKAANQLWLAHPLFAPAHEQPAVSACLAQMVGDYSGLYWIDRDLHRSIDPPDIQRLNQIAAPTLVILGERDVSDFHAIAGILQESISGAQKAILPGVGHMSSMEAPQRFNEVVLDFLVSL